MEANILLKQRSITACMKTSYDLMTSRFIQLIKQTWNTNLPFAILLGITLYFMMPNKALHDWGALNPWLSFILQTIIYAGTLVMFVVTIIFTRRWLKKQTADKEEDAKEDATKQTADKEATAASEAPAPQKLSLGKRMVSILRHLGGYMLTCFLGGLICLVLICITCLPVGIIAAAQMFSQLGALDGDPLGTPGYFTPLLMVILFATCFVIIYLIHWLGITLAYQHGSYSVQDAEKAKLKANLV